MSSVIMNKFSNIAGGAPATDCHNHLHKDQELDVFDGADDMHKTNTEVWVINSLNQHRRRVFFCFKKNPSIEVLKVPEGL